MANASEDMMVQRAKTSTNSNFLIIQHYDKRGDVVLEKFQTNRNDMNNININKNKNDIVYSAYGHDHVQQCDNYSSYACQLIRTGGGGGCCHEDTLRGFFPISFNDNKEMIQEYDIQDSLLTCQYPCNTTIDNMLELEIDTCCNHIGDHGVDCTKYDLNKVCVNDAIAFCT